MIDDAEANRRMMKRLDDAGMTGSFTAVDHNTGSPLFNIEPAGKEVPHISLPNLLERIIALEARIHDLEARQRPETYNVHSV